MQGPDELEPEELELDDECEEDECEEDDAFELVLVDMDVVEPTEEPE